MDLPPCRSLALAVVVSATSLAALPAHAISLADASGKLDCPDLGNGQACAQRLETKLLTSNAGLIERRDGALFVRLLDGSQMRASGNCPTCLNAVDLQLDGRFLVLRQQLEEGDAWQLIDRKTGELTATGGYTLPSPDGQRLLAAACDLEAGWSETVLDVYEIRPEGIRLAYSAVHAVSPRWGPREVRWDGNDAVSFQRTTTTNTGAYMQVSARLFLQAGRWQIQ